MSQEDKQEKLAKLEGEEDWGDFDYDLTSIIIGKEATIHILKDPNVHR